MKFIKSVGLNVKSDQVCWTVDIRLTRQEMCAISTYLNCKPAKKNKTNVGIWVGGLSKEGYFKWGASVLS
jgi:hypothetical protein